MYIRSAEAVLYYLGQIVRYENEKSGEHTVKTIIRTDCRNESDLFLVRPALPQDKYSPVAVEYDGTKDVIPRISEGQSIDCPSDVSMESWGRAFRSGMGKLSPDALSDWSMIATRVRIDGQ